LTSEVCFGPGGPGASSLIVDLSFQDHGHGLVRRLPLVDNGGRLVGIVCLDDLLRYLARELSNLADGIRDEMVVR
jgi:CBS domain-containing protein